MEEECDTDDAGLWKIKLSYYGYGRAEVQHPDIDTCLWETTTVIHSKSATAAITQLIPG